MDNSTGTFWLGALANFLGGTGVTLAWFLVDNVRQSRRNSRLKVENLKIALDEVRQLRAYTTRLEDPAEDASGWQGHSSAGLAAAVRAVPGLSAQIDIASAIGTVERRLEALGNLRIALLMNSSGVSRALSDSEDVNTALSERIREEATSLDADLCALDRLLRSRSPNSLTLS